MSRGILVLGCLLSLLVSRQEDLKTNLLMLLFRHTSETALTLRQTYLDSGRGFIRVIICTIRLTTIRHQGGCS